MSASHTIPTYSSTIIDRPTIIAAVINATAILLFLISSPSSIFVKLKSTNNPEEITKIAQKKPIKTNIVM